MTFLQQKGEVPEADLPYKSNVRGMYERLEAVNRRVFKICEYTML